MAQPILVLAEMLRGEIPDTTFELLGAGRGLANALGVPLYALLPGRNTAALATRLGAADQVFTLEDGRLDPPFEQAAAAALHQVWETVRAGLILVGSTNVSLGVGALLRARTGLPLVNFCRAARVEGSVLVLTAQLCGGKVLAEVRLPTARGIVACVAGAFPAQAGQSERRPPLTPMELAAETPPIVFKRYLEPEPGTVDITKQTVLVAVGRGIQSRDNLQLAEELAAALGGAVCASRPVIDQGWLPPSRQVGKSGLSVKPRVYLALGISGAPEHWEGMQHSECIIAVNTDPRAPIFDGAHYGVVADALELLPVLTATIKAHQR